MRNLIEDKKGQFIIIAFLMIAIMIISIGAIMHEAVTYYKHEPWEEYLSIIGNIELNSRRVVELSLANYTSTLDLNGSTVTQEVLRLNLQRWQSDLTRIYPGYGVALGIHSPGLTVNWNNKSASSIGNTTLTLNITSIGLRTYKFRATTLLTLGILGSPSNNKVNVTMTQEDGKSIANLKADNFQVNGIKPIGVTSRYYNETYPIIYTLRSNSSISSPVTVKAWDMRGIQVTAECNC